MKRGLDWYQRKPVNYLGGVQGMSAREHAVYGVILELIYVHGGYINNDPAWIAGWISDMGAAAVRNTIAGLAERGKIIVADGQITQHVALEICEKQQKTPGKPDENLTKTSGKPEKNDADLSAKSSKPNDLAQAGAAPRKDKSRKKEANASSARKRASRLPEDWALPKAWGDWALANTSLSPEQIREEAQKMSRWSRASPKGACLDWYARWQNWAKEARPQTPPKGPNGGKADDRLARKLAFFAGSGSEERPAAGEGLAGDEDRDVPESLLALRVVGGS